MRCAYCEKEIPENTKYCPHCGAKQEGASVPQPVTPPEAASAANQNPNTAPRAFGMNPNAASAANQNPNTVPRAFGMNPNAAPAANQNPNTAPRAFGMNPNAAPAVNPNPNAAPGFQPANPNAVPGAYFAGAAQQPQKKKKKHGCLIAFLIILVLLGVLVAFLWSPIKGFVLRNFYPEKYVEYVGEKVGEQVAENVAEASEDFLNFSRGKSGKKESEQITATFTFSQEAKNLLNSFSDYIGVDVGIPDLISWIEGLKVSSEVGFNRNLLGANVALSGKNTELMKLYLALSSDPDNRAFYTSIPTYMNKTLRTGADVLEALPDPDTFESLLERYSVILLQNLGEAETGETLYSVDVGEAEEKTVLCGSVTWNVSSRDLCNALRAMEAEAENDRELRGEFERIQNISALVDEDDRRTWEDLIADWKEYLAAREASADDSTVFVLTEYVNWRNHLILGTTP